MPLKFQKQHAVFVSCCIAAALTQEKKEHDPMFQPQTPTQVNITFGKENSFIITDMECYFTYIICHAISSGTNCHVFRSCGASYRTSPPTELQPRLESCVCLGFQATESHGDYYVAVGLTQFVSKMDS